MNTFKQKYIKRKNSFNTEEWDKLDSRLDIRDCLWSSIVIALFMIVPQIIRHHNVVSFFSTSLFIFAFYFLMSFSCYRICTRFMWNTKIEQKWIRFVVSIVCSTINLFFLFFSFEMLRDWIFSSSVNEEITKTLEHIQNRVYNSLSIGQAISLELFRSVFFASVICFVAHHNHILRGRKQIMLEIEELQQENFETRLKLLKQQISPHFLFNALSTLRSMVTEDKSKLYISQLSNVYRYLLTNDRKSLNLINVQDDLNFTKSYLYIQQERFEDALQINIEIDENINSLQIPPLALQILIENAIKHNIISIDEPLCIKIYNESTNFLVVQNNVQPKLSSLEGFGIGLENIRERYQLLGERNIEIEETKTLYTVKIPLLSNF